MRTPSRQFPLLLGTCCLLTGCGVSSRLQGFRFGPEAANDRLTGSGEVAATLGRGYVGAALREPFSYAASGIALLWHRPTELLRGNLPVAVGFGDTPPAAPGTDAFERWLDAQNLPRAHEGRLSTLIDGPEFFPALFKETREARESIKIQAFIFDNDDFAVAYAEMLRKRADEVRVRVLFDDLGTSLSSMAAPESSAPPGFIPPSNIAKVLKRKPTQLEMRRTLNPWLVADHTKMFLFDDRCAFVGGMNIGREYRSEWHDLMVKVEGPVVEALAADFEARWKATRFPGPLPFSGDPAALHDGHRNPQQARNGIRILRTDIVEPRYEILQANLAGIRAARKRVWLQTPYFSSDSVEHELLAACRRGVDVRVVFPGECDSEIMRLANRASAVTLEKAGAKAYEYPGMTHLKAIICDQWAMVGSANLDTLSMQINRELNLATAEPRFVQELARRVFQADFQKSRRFRPEDARGLVPKVAEAVADQL